MLLHAINRKVKFLQIWVRISPPKPTAACTFQFLRKSTFYPSKPLSMMRKLGCCVRSWISQILASLEMKVNIKNILQNLKLTLIRIQNHWSFWQVLRRIDYQNTGISERHRCCWLKVLILSVERYFCKVKNFKWIQILYKSIWIINYNLYSYTFIVFKFHTLKVRI